MFLHSRTVLEESRTGSENKGLTMVGVKATLSFTVPPSSSQAVLCSGLRLPAEAQGLKANLPHDQVIQLTESQFPHPQNKVIKPYITKVL